MDGVYLQWSYQLYGQSDELNVFSIKILPCVEHNVVGMLL